MKTNRFFAFMLMLLIGGLSTSAYAGTDEEKTETRKVTSFSAIEVSTGIDLFLKQGDTEAVVVVADEEIIDEIITEVEDGVLKIHMKSGHHFFWDWSFSKKWDNARKVYVTFKNIEMLDASSGSDVESQNELVLKKLEVDASSGSDVDLSLNVEALKVHTSSGSDATLKGKADTFIVSASSGSDVDAGELKTRVCNADASSGSDINIYVTEKLDADASSGGDIRYSGDPKEKNTDESSGGDVYRK